jgi:hypothetical protein
MQVDPVLLSQQAVLIRLQDLELVHPPDQGGEQQRLPTAQQDRPTGEGRLLQLLRPLHRTSVL